MHSGSGSIIEEHNSGGLKRDSQSKRIIRTRYCFDQLVPSSYFETSFVFLRLRRWTVQGMVGASGEAATSAIWLLLKLIQHHPKFVVLAGDQ